MGRALLVGFALLLGLVGCARRTEPAQPAVGPTTFPPLGDGTTIEAGVRFHDVTVQRAGVTMRVWVYLPEKAVADKMPCVLVGAAGSHLIDGMKLGEGDRPEHLPYARTGFAVVAFEIDGAWPEGREPSDQEVGAAAQAFVHARAGVANAQAALEFAVQRVPNLDTKRVYVAGHSSAATLALLAAAAEPRFQACVAFAPVTDVEASVGEQSIRELNGSVPGFAEFAKTNSPRARVSELKCPVFLFHAQDDDVVPPTESTRFAAELQKANPNTHLVLVQRGGHHRSMITQGIPQAITWLKALPK